MHVILINVVYPATATVFFGMLMNVLTFQVFDFSDIYNKILGLKADDEGNSSLSPQFDIMGYTSLYIIQNFGTLCWTIFVMPMAYAFAPLLVALFRG